MRISQEAGSQPAPLTSRAAPDPTITVSVEAFRRILRALRLAARKTRIAAGPRAGQLFVLRALQDGEEASRSEIAARTMTDRSSVAAVIERPLAAGLVARGTSREDRRRAAITMTAEGRKVLRRAPAPPTALLVAGLERVSHAPLASLAEGLGALTDAMGLNDQTPGMLFDDAEDAARHRTRRRATRR